MSSFARRLIAWYRKHKRDLPWRRTGDPYAIWVSEIMLQQTRVEAVIPYYRRFLERFPDTAALARAADADLLACWSGLGYYSRARNMRRAAQCITQNGGFPSGYEALRALPGIGPYTAAAVASIAFGRRHAVVDGNVLRVLARLDDDHSDISAPAVRKRFQARAQELLDLRRPGEFNQALMELGATVCLPRRPLCERCPLAADCRARARGAQAALPVKLGKPEPRHIEATLALVRRNGSILMRRRPDGESRMPGFWELPEAGDLPGVRLQETLGEFRHSITHHRYRFTVRAARAGRVSRDFSWIAEADLARLPVSTVARKALALK